MPKPTSFVDRAIAQFDNSLRTLAPGAANASRPNPASEEPYAELDASQRKHIAGLMRINHTGEVCAQALYKGQAATAKLGNVRHAMEEAAEEEIDHLVWCEERLRELGSRTSLLNPAFYAASYTIGAAAGLVSDKVSLGFVAATEEQVCKHLESHLEQLPANDKKSQAILSEMLEDEAEHATKAMAAGGVAFPKPVQSTMTLLSKVMTKTTYRI